MHELLEFSSTGPIVFYTILLCISMLYWVMVIVGAMDLGSFDLDLDLDMDVDVDIDVDVDMDVDVDADVDAAGSGGSLLMGSLSFFNFGKVPFMVIFSFTSFIMWLLVVVINFKYSDGSIWFPLVIAIPILFLGLIVTKIITTPLIGLFAALRRGDAKVIDFVGLTGEVVTSTSANTIGQLEIMVEQNHIRLYIKAEENQKGIIERDTKVVIVRVDEDDKDLYIVVPL